MVESRSVSQCSTRLRACAGALAALGVIGGIGLIGGPPAAAQSCVPLAVPLDTASHQVGRLTSMGNGQARISYEYDALGRATKTAHAFDGTRWVVSLSYGYPQNPAATPGAGSVPRSQTFPDGEVVSYAYDASGALQSLTATRPGQAAQAILSSLRRNARAQTVQVAFGNGAVTTRSFNDTTDLRLREIATVAGAVTQQRLTYGVDANGSISSVTDAVVPGYSATYGYDSLEQLTSMGGSITAAYSYDAAGNLTSKEGVTQTYGGAGRGPHALATAGGVTYSYDDNGNVAATSAGLALAWNAENLAVRATLGGQEKNRKWFLGERLWKEVENGVTTYYLPSFLVENGQCRKLYGNFAERSPDGSLQFYHPDHLGSSTVVTDSAQQVSHRIAYMPYGGDRGVAGGGFQPRFQFNFKEKEATGLYDYGARLYNPGTGRWMSPDNLTADGLNRYAYVRNHPITFVDLGGKAGTWAFRDNGNSYEWKYFNGRAAEGWTPYTVGENGSVITLLNGAQIALFRNGKHETLSSDPGSDPGRGGPAPRRDTATYAASALGGAVQALSSSPVRWLLEKALGMDRASYLEIPDRAAAVNPKTAFVGGLVASVLTGKFLVSIGGTGPTTQLFGLREGRNVYLIGRFPDTLVKRLPGERVLNISEWTLEKNDLWVRNVIQEGGYVNTATPINPATLWNFERSGAATFTREIDQFLKDGFRLRSGTLVPPN